MIESNPKQKLIHSQAKPVTLSINTLILWLLRNHKKVAYLGQINFELTIMTAPTCYLIHWPIFGSSSECFYEEKKPIFGGTRKLKKIYLTVMREGS